MLKQFATVVVSLVLSVSLTACATSKGASPQEPGVEQALDEPVTFTNCGEQLTFNSAPQRIITMNDHVTEVLLELGLGDRIVGMGYGKAEPRPDLAEQWAQIPSLADEYPSMEQILDANPDLVVGGMASAFNEKEGRSREAFAEHGIPTFLFTEYCSEESFSLDALSTDYTQLGQATGTEDAAAGLVEQVTSDLDEISDAVAEDDPIPTFLYDSGDAEPLTVGGVGVGNLIVENAGGTNLFADRERPYTQTSWEQVAERAPEAIIVLDYGDRTAEQKIQFLTEHPLMKTTPAVKKGRFVVVPLDDFFESPRLVDSTRTIARALHPNAEI